MRNPGILLVPVLFAAGLSAQTTSVYVNAGSDNQSWVIGNALIERRIQFDAKTGLYTAAWRHKLTGTDFIKPAPGETTAVRSSPFRLTATAWLVPGAPSI